MRGSKTNVIKRELQAMTDDQFIEHMKKFPYPSQWQFPQAFQYAELRLSHMQGDVYLSTGNINAFRSRPLVKDFIPI